MPAYMTLHPYLNLYIHLHSPILVKIYTPCYHYMSKQDKHPWFHPYSYAARYAFFFLVEEWSICSSSQCGVWSNNHQNKCIMLYTWAIWPPISSNVHRFTIYSAIYLIIIINMWICNIYHEAVSSDINWTTFLCEMYAQPWKEYLFFIHVVTDLV